MSTWQADMTTTLPCDCATSLLAAAQIPVSSKNPATAGARCVAGLLTFLMRFRTDATALFLSMSCLQPENTAATSLLCSCTSLQLALKALIAPRNSSSRLCSCRPDQAARMTSIL